MMDTAQRRVGGPLLDVAGVSRYYGALAAVSDVSFSVQENEILGLIGPNGAGKTTLIGLLSGTIPISGGDVRYRGRSIAGMRPFQIGRLGIIRTFQLVQPFAHLTVRECAMLGALFGSEEGRSRSVIAARGEADAILELVGLADKAGALADQLNIPERKRLEIARGLAARPVLLLLDEVLAGLSAREIEGAVDLIRTINARGVAIIMIEHIVEALSSVCPRIMVLHHGRKIAEGTMDEVLANELVRKDYLGRAVSL
jgi:branched-chain amino acid transport system ATP-binding protein